MLTPYSANSPKPESADSSDSNPLPSTQRQNRRKNYIFPLPSPYESRFPISIGRTPILVETHNMANTPSSSQNPTTPHPPALRPTKTPPLHLLLPTPSQNTTSLTTPPPNPTPLANTFKATPSTYLEHDVRLAFALPC